MISDFALMHRAAALKRELKRLANPKVGDIYANEFGTVIMLLPGDKTVWLIRDNLPNVKPSSRSWADVIEDPVYRKATTVDLLLKNAEIVDP